MSTISHMPPSTSLWFIFSWSFIVPMESRMSNLPRHKARMHFGRWIYHSLFMHAKCFYNKAKSLRGSFCFVSLHGNNIRWKAQLLSPFQGVLLYTQEKDEEDRRPHDIGEKKRE
ncbi:hypothetical protein BX666DRAFT_86323 [Dichotomocladium elegans]|nr:hypothetical protein BX666DRAFT_86323 [Dichotomocladium elegans]